MGLSLFGGQYLQQRLTEADDLLRGQRENVLPSTEFRQLRAATQQIKRATNNCVVVAAEYDTTATASNGDKILAAYSLSPSDANQTGWQLIDVVRSLDSEGNRLPDSKMFDTSVEELSDVLDNTCNGGDGA